MPKLDLPLNHLFIPATQPSKKLMIVLHGRGDSSEGFTFLPRYLNIPEMNYLLLDAPYDYYGGFSWYDLPPHQLSGIEYSREMLTKIFDQLFTSDYAIKESFLFGFSQGSLLTFEFGARYPHSLAGYIAVSGYIYDAYRLLEEIHPSTKEASWLCTHGIDDTVLPYEISRKQVNILQEGGLPINFHTYSKPHTIIEEELAMIRDWIIKRVVQ